MSRPNIFYEEAARIPMLVKWPAAIPAGHKSDTCLSNVDIMPTLLGLIGVDSPGEVEGMDLSHCARAEPGPEPEFAFLQNTGACAAWEDGHEWRAIRTKQYTYAVYKVDGRELLFDNTADPYQRVNLAAAGAAADPGMTGPGLDRVRSELRRKMDARMAALNDGFEP